MIESDADLRKRLSGVVPETAFAEHHSNLALGTGKVLDALAKAYGLERRRTFTELDQARAHLRKCQADLHRWRNDGGPWQFLQRSQIEEYQNAVLAALSWVWDAQQRDAERQEREQAAEFFRGLGMDATKVLIEHPIGATDTWSAVGLMKEMALLGVPSEGRMVILPRSRKSTATVTGL
jgi:hypothetical protein